MPDTYRVFDASSQIPAQAPDGYHGVAGYLNSKEAADPWTLADWLRFGHLRQFPWWVAAYQAAPVNPIGQAKVAVSQVTTLGWHKGRIILCDMEAVSDLDWWRVWRDTVQGDGFTPGWYGSPSAAPPASEARFRIIADPDGNPVIPDGFQGKQYAWGLVVPGGVINASVFTAELYDHGGRGPRHRPGAASAIRADLASIIPHPTAVTATKGTTMSAVDKLKDYLESHRGELEQLLEVAVEAPANPYAAAIDVLKSLSSKPVEPVDPTSPAPDAAAATADAGGTAAGSPEADAEQPAA